ncbi:MAG: hypothetical protein PVF49_01695 [Anaerolineales bacterium]|jgi:hypothetical protein
MTHPKPELYIATDVEADGPIPGPYSMISLGMSVVGHPDQTFYTEIKPISDDFYPDALAVSGLDREKLLQEAPDAKTAMQMAFDWVNNLKELGTPVFLAAPAVWDGMFVHWYFMRFVGQSPFSPTGAGIDLRSYWMGVSGLGWVDSRKGHIINSIGLHDLEHTHHAGEDAIELAQIFEAAMQARRDQVD